MNNETSAITAKEDGPVKSAKQLKKEAEKAAKLQKLQEKLNKQAATAAASSTKEKSEVRIAMSIKIHPTDHPITLSSNHNVSCVCRRNR